MNLSVLGRCGRSRGHHRQEQEKASEHNTVRSTHGGSSQTPTCLETRSIETSIARRNGRLIARLARQVKGSVRGDGRVGAAAAGSVAESAATDPSPERQRRVAVVPCGLRGSSPGPTRPWRLGLGSEEPVGRGKGVQPRGFGHGPAAAWVRDRIGGVVWGIMGGRRHGERRESWFHGGNRSCPHERHVETLELGFWRPSPQSWIG